MRGTKAVVIGLLLGACSSRGKAGMQGAPGGVGGFGGGVAVGSGGVVAGGSGGAGGSGIVDAGPSDVASPGSGGSGGATTAAEVCRAALGALCDRVATCSGGPVGSPCDDIASACPDYLFNAASTRTVAAVSGCLADLRSLSCADLDLGLRPTCLSRGTLPAGEPCAYPSNCQGGDCSGGNTTCGTCRGNAAASGASCADGSACPAGDFCHRGTRLCTPGSAIIHVGAGQACDLAAVTPVSCTGDLHCVTPDGGTAGTCELPEPTIVVGVGQACDTIHVCGAGLICFTDITLTGDASTMSSACMLENPCGSGSCDATTFCKTADGGTTCAPKATAAEVCRNDGGRSTTPCMDPLYCSSATGACTALGKQGDPCDDRAPCAAYFVCASGACVPLSTQVCSTIRLDGGAD